MLKRTMIKAFIAGLAFPAVFFPFAYTGIFFYSGLNLQLYPLQFMPLYLPLIFGLTNIIYAQLCNLYGSQYKNFWLWLVGILLGLAVAATGVFYLKLPQLLFNLSGNYVYLPLILLPIIYGIVFRYIIKWLNNIVDLP